MRFSFALSKTKLKRLLQGAFLGFGAPIGWFLLSSLNSLSVSNPLYEPCLFAYMTVGTIGVFGVFGFILGRHEQQFAELSFIDSLTGLFNPRFFHLRFRQELSRCARLKQPLALMIADIDFFKRVNDTYGHQAGDVVLRHVADILVTFARESDVVARVGGEEFAVVLPETGHEGAVAMAERMRQQIENSPVRLDDGRSISFTVSFGVCIHQGALGRPDFLYAQADKALYRAKANGRNAVAVATLDAAEDE